MKYTIYLSLLTLLPGLAAGAPVATAEQKADMAVIFPKVKNLDFVAAWYKKAADQGNQEASNRIGRLVMNGKIDDEGITIYSTQETGLTLGDIEDMSH